MYIDCIQIESVVVTNAEEQFQDFLVRVLKLVGQKCRRKRINIIPTTSVDVKHLIEWEGTRFESAVDEKRFA